MLRHGPFGLFRDEVWGVFAIGALRAGDVEGAAKILCHARFGYLARFFLRLALVAPQVAMRTAFWLVANRRKRPATRDGGRRRSDVRARIHR